MASIDSARRPLGLPLALIGLGVIGFIAAFALTLDKFALLENPDAQLSCNFSVLIGCSTNLNSPQGEVFGFPNSLLGIVFWSATITVGVALLAGAALSRWFWALFALGAAGSLAFVIWFISQSIFVLHVLCPWCMVTWAVTIPLFWVVVLHAARSGAIPLPESARRSASVAFGWIPFITLACYLVVGVLAQWQLDVLVSSSGEASGMKKTVFLTGGTRATGSMGSATCARTAALNSTANAGIGQLSVIGSVRNPLAG